MLDKKERVVILGSGWAGFSLGRTLSPKKNDRIIISPRSHFVFTPLLASTCAGTLEFRTAIEPVRRLQLTEFHSAWADRIDFANKTIRVESNTATDAASATVPMAHEKGQEYDVKYDKLVLAVGCYSQTFGIEGVSEHASFLRDVGDARKIRLRVLRAFEEASLPQTTDARRKELLHFAVVGGGPTGIEFAAELHDLIHEDLAKLYPRTMEHVNITIYDIAPKVLPMFDQNLADYATDLFARKGINVMTKHQIQHIRREGDILYIKTREEEHEVGASTVVWSTGLMQNPFVGELLKQPIPGIGSIVKDGKTGGISVDSHMRVLVQGEDGGEPKALPDVYAIGDCAVDQNNRLPATAQVASQQAVYVGKQLNLDNPEDAKPFKFRNWGTMTYLGGWRAIHQSQGDELKGRAAWILWRTAYLTKSMSIRNKIMIPVYWAITWIFGRDISRF